MRNLTINDITLCTALAAEQLSFREKVQAARLLGKMHEIGRASCRERV